MRCATVVAGMLILAVVGQVGAEEAPKADAPKLLKEALQKGRAEPADIGAIVSWVLHEKEETVASGFAEVLGALDLPAGVKGRDAERWAPTVSALADVFAAALRDAEKRRPRKGSDVPPELAALLRAAAPAISASLREADPESLAGVRAALNGFAQAAGSGVVRDLRKALEDADPEVREAARQALEELGEKVR
jgi:hypothetical protein